MARMYPSIYDAETKSPAEKLLYECFQKELDNDYTVFHSVAWQAIDANGRIRDGETDFIISHPNQGILVMEAKGGIIRYEGESRNWYSISKNDQRPHHIKDPFRQAKTSKYTLNDMLSKMSGYPPYKINLGHAVAFPDVLVDRNFIGLDRPREIILSRPDLANLSSWVGQCMAYWRGKSTQADTAPTQVVVDNLIESLGKSWELRPKMWGEFQFEEQQFIHLTQQQYLYLDFLNCHRRAAICGCAGSGKTMIVVEKATRLAKQGFKTLLTCFNKTLALDLRGKLSSVSNLDIIHFHELCYEIAEKAEMLPGKITDDGFFDILLPEALIPAADKLGIRYQAIVVDEGQDFQENWWIPLQLMLENPDEDILYIFYDDNQRIYVPDSKFPIQSTPHTLTTNCRNTQSIHRVIMKYYQSMDRPSARGPHGRPVEVLIYKNRSELRELVHKVLRNMDKEGVPNGEIAILTMLNKLVEQFWSDELSSDWPPEQGKIYCSTVHSFKGLERSVIILTGIEKWILDEWQDIEKLLYVGCSRARNHLIVIMSESAEQLLGQHFNT